MPTVDVGPTVESVTAPVQETVSGVTETVEGATGVNVPLP